MFEEQGIIAELRGMQSRLERAISQLSEQNYAQWQLSCKLRSLTGVCESLLRLWGMTDEEVAEQHLLNVYDRPRERMLDIMFKQLQREIDQNGPQAQRERKYEQIEFNWPDEE